MNYNNTQKGFTLIEMVAVLGIFAVMTAIVVFNYNKFRSDTILTNMAYEMALSIREAQVYGVSVRNAVPGGNADLFSKPYGIFVPVLNNSQYFLFADLNNDSKYSGTDCAANQAPDVCVIPYSLQRNIVIESIYLEGNCNSAATINQISILFKRPNPEPIINIGVNAINFSRVQLAIKAPDGAKRYVVVANNGQISVENQPICPGT